MGELFDEMFSNEDEDMIEASREDEGDVCQVHGLFANADGDCPECGCEIED